MSPAAVEAEFAHLCRVYESLRRSGYRRHPAHQGDIEGEVLTRGSDFRVLLGVGQHRAAALAALAFATAPVRLSPVIIRRDDVRHWPNVVRGFFDRTQALAVFDRIFDGRQPFAAMRPQERAPRVPRPPQHHPVSPRIRKRVE